MKTSVVVCTYNGQRFLRQQLYSILIQSIAVSEIVVCDDASADDTQSILKEYEQAYPGLFRVFHNPANIGVVRNFEQAIQYCTGDIIFFSDQDDIWEADKVARCIAFFDANPGKFAVFSDACLIDAAGKKTGKTIWEHLQFREALQLNAQLDIFRFLLLYRNVVTGACLVIKKDALPDILPFPATADLLHDQWIGLKLAAENKISWLDGCLVQYRVHPSQQTKSLWQPNAKANAFRSSLISDDASRFPAEYYRYWKKKPALLHSLYSLGINIPRAIIEEVENNIRKGLISYMKTLPMLRRKLQLLRSALLRKGPVKYSDLWRI